ncbi:MAG: hypothetical protein Q8P41_13895 [Pseudomonadota bacterium]|nr:hypothetical protein [Pseudomonadota bacterium]
MPSQQRESVSPVVSPAPQAQGPGTSGSGAGNAAAQAQMQLRPATGATAPASPPAAAGPGVGPAALAVASTNLDALRTAAAGSVIGNVDEEECLRLVALLTPAEQAAAAADTTLMQNLAGALDQDEIVVAVNALHLPLKWKAWWIEQAGETEDVADASWRTMVAGAPMPEVLEFIGWADLFNRTFAAKSSPILLALVDVALDATRLLDVMAGATRADGVVAAALSCLEAYGPGWAALTTGLPVGSALGAPERAALDRLVSAGTPTDAHAMELFRIRFNTRIENDTGTWTLVNIRSVWQQLDVLPDQDVSDNTVLEVFNATSGGGGLQGGDYIELGEDQPDVAELQHTVRHEIGHTVHDGPLKAQVDSWLRDGVKMWYYSADDAGFRSWVNDLGGFPAEYTDAAGATQTFGAAEQQRVIDMLLAFNGGGEAWDPARPTVYDPATAGDEQMWNAMPGDVRNAVDQSVGNWYTNHGNWQSGPKGKYFLNYWYRTPYYMSAEAEAIVDLTEDYASMSHFELFADAYAEFFEDPAGYTDRTKWGGGLDDDTKAFFNDTVIDHQPYTPPAAGAGVGAAPPAAAAGTP